MLCVFTHHTHKTRSCLIKPNQTKKNNMAQKIKPRFSLIYFALSMLYSVLILFSISTIIFSTTAAATTATGFDGKFSCFDLASDLSKNGTDRIDDRYEEPYRLFSTKTTYLNARKELHKIFDVSKWPPVVPSDRCEPIYLYFLNRHSIRYPSLKEIRQFAAVLPAIRDDLVAGGKLDRTIFRDFLTWRLLMNEADENHVSFSGKLDTALTAQIFYKYFPTLLDIENVNFEVSVTPKIRTTETARAFIRSLIGLQLKRNDTSDPAQLDDPAIDEIMRRKFPSTQNDILMSHKKCKKLMENNPPPKVPPEYKLFAASETFSRLLASFSARNGLRYTITFDSLVVVYRACSYEFAINRDSPWCHLFNGAELRIMDYLMDMSEYFDAYGIEAHRKLGCTVIGDLYHKLQSIIEQSHESQNRYNATLYFSHENLLSKVISYLQLFPYFPHYESDQQKPYDYDDDHLQRICIPHDREWRSSLLVPFGTNFATVLYRCDTNAEEDDDENEYARETESSPSYKLLTLLNEIPVKIRGCDSELCELNQFFAEYRSATTEACDLKKICKI